MRRAWSYLQTLAKVHFTLQAETSLRQWTGWYLSQARNASCTTPATAAKSPTLMEIEKTDSMILLFLSTSKRMARLPVTHSTVALSQNCHRAAVFLSSLTAATAVRQLSCRSSTAQ